MDTPRKRERTFLKPGRSLLAGTRGRGTPFWDPEAITPVRKGESVPLFSAGIVLGFFALLVCYAKGYLLLYGDAVAHLGIARRIVDSHYPGLSQLGGVWLPLPHVLMLPFVAKMSLWQTGMAAVPMAVVSYALSVAGLWRLGRRVMRLRWAFTATLFYALNPNLLYLATTAMTEALFLALLIWTVIAVAEGAAALRAQQVRVAGERMILAGLLVMGQVFTRYDGWIVGAAAWAWLAWAWWKSEPGVRRRTRGAFVAMTVLCAAGPLLWFWYNAHFEGDWLDFMRGPYSAKAIERKTAPPGQHYRGWHNPGWALLFYMRTAQVDASAGETGFALMAAALWGAWKQVSGQATVAISSGKSSVHGLDGPSSKEVSTAVAGRRASCPALLLWVPLPFYIYSVTWGSVPIFIPQLWPHAFYNARYGMEMLPALALYGALASQSAETWLRDRSDGWARVGARLWQPGLALLCVLNSIAMMYRIPLVLKEGMVNATTRVPFERLLANVLAQLPPEQPVLMSTSAHVGAVQGSGRTLQSVVSENDEVAWEAALAAPAKSAAYVIAMAGDPVEKAVTAHPEGLQALEVLRSTGQPPTRVYRSTLWPSRATP